MKTIITMMTLLLAVVTSVARADLQALDNDSMESITGQGGADMSFFMQLNQNSSGAFTCGSGVGQTPLKNCRLGMSLNNRDVDGSGNAVTTGSGKKLWLVFKGIQGTLNFQHIGLDGTDLLYNNDGGTSVSKAAIQLTFDPTKPILIRNFGFNSLSVETDTVANEGAGNVPGYLSMATGTGTATTGVVARDDYTNGVYGAAAGFDAGREVGFIGLNIHGNLASSGTMKIFGCDAGHPRC